MSSRGSSGAVPSFGVAVGRHRAKRADVPTIVAVIVVCGLIVAAFMWPRRTVVVSSGTTSRFVQPVAPATQAALPSGVVSRVAPAAPTEISFMVNGSTVPVKDKVGVLYVSQHADGGWSAITPPEDSLAELGMAFWWGNGLSFQPGDPSAGTTYIYGHSCQKWSGCAFNKLGQLRANAQVTLTTPNGVLTYRVNANPRSVKRKDLPGDTQTYYNRVNRLVLITCLTADEVAKLPDGKPSNWVVDLSLVSSEPSR